MRTWPPPSGRMVTLCSTRPGAGWSSPCSVGTKYSTGPAAMSGEPAPVDPPDAGAQRQSGEAASARPTTAQRLVVRCEHRQDAGRYGQQEYRRQHEQHEKAATPKSAAAARPTKGSWRLTRPLTAQVTGLQAQLGNPAQAVLTAAASDRCRGQIHCRRHALCGQGRALAAKSASRRPGAQQPNGMRHPRSDRSGAVRCHGSQLRRRGHTDGPRGQVLSLRSRLARRLKRRRYWPRNRRLACSRRANLGSAAAS